MTSPAAGSGDPDVEPLAEGVRRLEAELRATRRNGARALKQLHAAMVRDLHESEKRAASAEKQLAAARRRAKSAEAELARLRASGTWRAGRAVTAVPSAVRRRLRGGAP